jgi:EmrB/QacA subfamily drug resistance transporter
MTEANKANAQNLKSIDYSRKWWVLGSVAMGVFLATIDGSIVNIALPTLEEALRTDFATVQWVVLAYLLTITTLLLSIGRLADMFGKKKLYLTGMVIFTVGSLLCSLSTQVGWLIAFRVLQAVGGAMMMALGTAITTEAFPDQERGKALGIQGLVVSVGIIAGPAIGGILLGSLTWHWIFYVNLPIGLLGLFLVMKNVPHIKPVGKQTFDFSGAVTLLISLTSFLMALTIGQQAGFLTPIPIVLFLMWAGFLAAFIWIQRRKDQPMMDLSLFSNRLFSVNLMTGFLTYLASSGTILLMPFYLENILKHDPQAAGLMLAVLPISMGLAAPLAGSLSDRVGTRALTVVGLILAAAGYAWVSTLNQATTTLGYVVRYIPLGIGMGIFQSPNNSAIMGSAPKHRLGVASGLLAITRTLGQTSGISIFGALWAARILTYGGSAFAADVTAAPASVQVFALQDVIRFICVIILIALGMSVYALVSERRGQKMPASQTEIG